MDKYYYYILLIILINCLLIKFYFLNNQFIIIEKNKLKKNYEIAKDNYINQQPELIIKLAGLTKELNEQLNILQN